MKVVYGISLVVDFFDRKVIDGIVNGFATASFRFGNLRGRSRPASCRSYAALMVVGLSVIVILLFLFGGLR